MAHKNKAKRESKCKRIFQIMTVSQANKLCNSQSVRAGVYDEVEDIIPKSYFTELMEGSKRKCRSFVHENCTSNISHLAHNLKILL